MYAGNFLNRVFFPFFLKEKKTRPQKHFKEKSPSAREG